MKSHKINRREFLGATAALGAVGLVGSGAALAAPRRRAPDRPTATLPGRGELVVRGARVVTMDPALGDLPSGDVHVRDGEIVAVGMDLAAPGATTFDGRGMIVLPGLVETHWHLWTGLARAMTGGQPERGYLALVGRLGREYAPEDTYRAVRLGLAEALDSGITTVHDWSHNIRGPEYADASLRAHADVGLRGRFSYGAPQGLPPDQTIDLDDLARVQREWFGAPGGGLTTLGLAARGSQMGPPEVYRREWEAARTLGIPITMHAATSPASAAARAIEALGRDGLLGPDVQIVHAIRATPADRALMASTGTSLSISPRTELLFGWGPPQIAEMLADGVLVSLSIDNTPLAGTADPFATMRLTLDLAAAQSGAELGFSPRRVLEMATIDGARDLRLDHRVGSLTPGKRADLILVRTTDLNMASAADPVDLLVRSAQPANVDTVVVDGRVLKRNGQLAALDAEEVVREAGESLAAVRTRAGDS